jgi:hypothetical protein
MINFVLARVSTGQASFVVGTELETAAAVTAESSTIAAAPTATIPASAGDPPAPGDARVAGGPLVASAGQRTSGVQDMACTDLPASSNAWGVIPGRVAPGPPHRGLESGFEVHTKDQRDAVTGLLP